MNFDDIMAILFYFGLLITSFYISTHGNTYMLVRYIFWVLGLIMISPIAGILVERLDLKNLHRHIRNGIIYLKKENNK